MPGREIVGPIPEGKDPDSYDRLRRVVLKRVVYGLYIVASRFEKSLAAMTINFVTQVATSPKLFAFSFESASKTLGIIRQARAFNLQFIPRNRPELARKYAKFPEHEEEASLLAGVPYELKGNYGLPVLEPVEIWVDFSLYEEKELGSHVLVLGEVQDVGVKEGVDPAQSSVLRMEDTRMSYGG